MVLNNFKLIFNNVYIILGYIYGKILIYSLIYIPDNFFVIFKIFNIINNYIIKADSYEQKNYINQNYIVPKNKLFDEFNILYSSISFKNDNHKINNITVTNKIYFIYLINKILNISDFSPIILYYTQNENYKMINIHITFSLNKMVYVKKIDYLKKKYEDTTPIMFGKIFYDNRIENNIFSDSEDED